MAAKTQEKKMSNDFNYKVGDWVRFTRVHKERGQIVKIHPYIREVEVVGKSGLTYSCHFRLIKELNEGKQ